MGPATRFGAYPAANPVTPGDLAATLFACFALDPATEIFDGIGRPYRLAEAAPLAGLFSG